MKKGLLTCLITTVLYSLVVYYLMYPCLNIHSFGFWMFVMSIIFVFSLVYSIVCVGNGISKLFNKKGETLSIKGVFSLVLIPVILLGIIIINFILSPLFNSRQYYKRINVVDGDFSTEIKEVDFNKLPLLDRDSSLKIGDRTMGQMSELVSQFDVSDQYTQINYLNEIVRVTPLEYSSLVKWITNRGKGIKGYITVNSL